MNEVGLPDVVAFSEGTDLTGRREGLAGTGIQKGGEGKALFNPDSVKSRLWGKTAREV